MDNNIERNVWSKCFLCEEEYSKENIRMNIQCFHSYCMECIEQTASTSLLCPICHSPLPSPLSSLPMNHALQYWQTVSPLPPFSLLSPLNNNENNEIEVHQKCDECEEQKEDVHYCSDCKTILCSSCSEAIHIRRTMKNHSISPLTLSSLLISTSTLPLSSPIIYFNQCELHKNEEKKLYCITCNECVCVDCTGDFHSNHSTKSVIKRVEEIKEEWKKEVEKISKEFIDDQQKSIDKNLLNDIDQVNEEIKMLEAKLKSLFEKKEQMINEMNKIKESKEKINQTTHFLLSFIQSLPSLPLSSFISSKTNLNNNNNNNNNIINEENKTEKKSGIKEFFEKENLISLFSTLVPSPTLPPSSSKIHIFQQRNIYTDKEKEKRNTLFLSNQLIQNENLLSDFGTFGSNPSQFRYPYYLAYKDKLNIMAVSDWRNNRVQILNRKGSLIRSFTTKSPNGILIIPSLNLLALCSAGKHLLEMLDISPLLSIPPHKTVHHPLPLVYTIGNGKGSSDNHFDNPYGMAFTEEKGILAISDYANKRIKLYSIRRDGYELHSTIRSMSINPNHIAISSPGDLLLVSGHERLSNTNYLKIFKEEMGNWVEEDIRAPPSLQPPLTSPRGVAIHSSLNYFAVCDVNHRRVLFFNLTTRDLICSFQPTLPPPSSSLYFINPCGINIDEEADLIAISDYGDHSITLFQSPIFGNIYA